MDNIIEIKLNPRIPKYAELDDEYTNYLAKVNYNPYRPGSRKDKRDAARKQRNRKAFKAARRLNRKG